MALQLKGRFTELMLKKYRIGFSNPLLYISSLPQKSMAEGGKHYINTEKEYLMTIKDKMLKLLHFLSSLCENYLYYMQREGMKLNTHTPFAYRIVFQGLIPA